MSSSKTFLIFSQTFVPDPAAVGQHIADVAFEMARRGHKVLVYTACRGYDDPNRVYPTREALHGVDIHRLRFSSFGKSTLLRRLGGAISFMLQCIYLALATPKAGAILFSTSPPMMGVVASFARLLRRIPTIYWAMDLNPDQLIAMQKIPAHGIVASMLEAANRHVLRNASLVVALDRFMAGRLRPRERLEGKMIVVGPWSHDQFIDPLEHDANPFRHKYELDGKFVVMYSGNHSPANPLETMLQAAVQFRDEPDIRFVFIGGGIGKAAVEAFIREHQLSNAIALPYQPQADLRYSLSAADVHVVSLGDNMVGIVHPCKIYGAMAVARPILYLGPRPSHVTDLLDQHSFGFQVAHGDVAGTVSAIRALRDIGPQRRAEMGAIGQSLLRQGLSQSARCGQVCDAIEKLI